MPGLIGKKIGMTSVFGADGKNIPCTVIEAGPCVVTQLRTVEKDGYAAVQLAYDEITEKHTSKPLQGHFKKAGTNPMRKLVEFEADFAQELKLGDTVSLSDVIVEGVEFVDVVGTSKGKGFQGVVKRHGFAGVGGQTHGQHNLEVEHLHPFAAHVTGHAHSRENAGRPGRCTHGTGVTETVVPILSENKRVLDRIYRVNRIGNRVRSPEIL